MLTMMMMSVIRAISRPAKIAKGKGQMLNCCEYTCTLYNDDKIGNDKWVFTNLSWQK